MKKLTLYRLADGPDGTIGVLGPYVTLEEENQGNRVRVSRIPAGTYTCRRRRYNRGGYDTFEVTNVRGRSEILFHAANTEEDLEGCIAIGWKLGALEVVDEDTKKRRMKAAVISSREAHGAFMELLRGHDEFELVVVDPGQG